LKYPIRSEDMREAGGLAEGVTGRDLGEKEEKDVKNVKNEGWCV
jgi:hypothetical protein